MSVYADEYRRSIDHPEAFWADQARRLPWFKAPETILEYAAAGHARWYVDGELNLCPSTIDDPASLGEIHEAMKARDLGAAQAARQV